jgi:hypothetical protein
MDLSFGGQFDRDTFLRAVSLANMPARRQMTIRAVGGVVLLAMYAVLLVATFTGGSPTEVDVARLARYLLGVPAVVAVLVWPAVRARMTGHRLWADPSVRGPFSGTVSTMGVTYRKPSGLVEMAWDEFIRVRATDDLAVLVTSDGVMAAFPKHFFDSERDWRAFRLLAEQRIPALT